VKIRKISPSMCMSATSFVFGDKKNWRHD
jgi:hypothetical protein